MSVSPKTLHRVLHNVNTIFSSSALNQNVRDVYAMKVSHIQNLVMYMPG